MWESKLQRNRKDVCHLTHLVVDVCIGEFPPPIFWLGFICLVESIEDVLVEKYKDKGLSKTPDIGFASLLPMSESVGLNALLGPVREKSGENTWRRRPLLDLCRPPL